MNTQCEAAPNLTRSARRRRLIDLATVAVLSVAVAVLLPWQWPTEMDAAAIPHIRTLDELLGLDLKTRHTLLIVVQESCTFCTVSMPFYRRIIDRRNTTGADLGVVVVAPPRDTDIRRYLGSHGVLPDHVVYAERGTIPVDLAPTLLMIGARARVVQRWQGALVPDQEDEVLRTLFDADAVR